MSDVEEKVKDIIVEELGVEREKAHPRKPRSWRISARIRSTPSSW